MITRVRTGMRRPSWNKSQAIQQVISLKALLEPSDDSGAGALRRIVASPPPGAPRGPAFSVSVWLPGKFFGPNEDGFCFGRVFGVCFKRKASVFEKTKKVIKWWSMRVLTGSLHFLGGQTEVLFCFIFICSVFG